MSTERRLLITMSTDWKKELENLKKTTHQQIEKKNEAEKKLREKFEGEKEKLLELIESQLTPVLETFMDENIPELDQPSIKKHQQAITLNLPIVSGGTHIGLEITFGFRFTDEGYAVRVRRSAYDHVQERTFEHQNFIQPPITAEKIQNQIRAFLNDRNYAIEMLAKKSRIGEREWR